MLNISFPWNVLEFGKLLEFAAGDLEEINEFIPDVLAELMDFE